MLTWLEIRDMILVDRLEIEFQPGLNVLTGETGAGKSILLGCLGFVLGGGARAGMLRDPEQPGEVTASFDIPDNHQAMEVLETIGLPRASPVLLRRRLRPDGRTVAYVNDRRCTLESLRNVAEGLVEMVGQHQGHGLLDPGYHLALLDQYAGADASSVRRSWNQWRESQDQLEAARRREDSGRQELDFLRHSVTEIDELAPEAGEVDRLEQKRRLARSSERIRDDLSRALERIGSHGADGQITEAIGWLSGPRAETEDLLDDAVEALDRAVEEIATAERNIVDCLEVFDVSPSDLEDIEERLFALKSLARKHGVQPDQLEEVRESLAERLSAIDGFETEVADLEAGLREAEASYRREAAGLSECRREAGNRLDAMMVEELPSLKLANATFSTEIVEAPSGPRGSDAVRFMASTNSGMPAGALDQIASGGELSRFLLALKACLAANDEPLMLVFDEIDQGVGGATADAVGRRLSALAKKTQILVVTHSPQVAACADLHFLVSKRDTDDRVGASVGVTALETDSRVAELARMLAGSKVTAQASAAAQALLDDRRQRHEPLADAGPG